ncbi:MAG: hypothetical protein KGH66_02695, partial [Candidatus Micrarchaeota archaeon]|nr:hypothetical protein [Candidatus Micrarchaeota archaeon]
MHFHKSEAQDVSSLEVIKYVRKDVALQIKILAGLEGLEIKQGKDKANIDWSNEGTKREKLNSAIKYIQEFYARMGRSPTYTEFIIELADGRAIYSA